MYPVVEKFISINGEGTRAGELAAFIRFRGCNLNCSYCDTRWANTHDAPAEYFTAEALARWVKETNVTNVTLTGGEPLLQEEIKVLIALLIEQGNSVEIETNGSVSLASFAQMERRPVFTMDYKLPASGMEGFMCMENFGLLKKQDTVKFVSGSMQDLERAAKIIEQYALLSRCHVYISPVFGKLNPADIVEYMIARNLNGVRLQLQLHKFIWDPDQKGV
ncbi:MAG: putative 7-carboxy-7-deazaguanine synthase QueE [Anaerotignum sp.]|nr:putative 7-carboxy-7-deazaguanine synthase QueE [Anaerotignum sp.]